ncbi:MAG: hypothetical protein ACE5EA_03510 [Nitrospirota bacterium]
MEVAREDFKECCIKEYLRRGKPWQPDVLLIEKDSQLIVIKDYLHRPFLYRVFVGIWSVWRESYIYRRLNGLSGVPKFYGKIDRYALAIEYIKGKNASECKKEDISKDFFIRLKEIVDIIHEKGIVICDMRNNKNIIIRDDGMPYIIDYCTAFERGYKINLIRNFIFNIFWQDDMLGIAKLKKRTAPELLSKEEEDGLTNGLFLQKEAIFIRKIVTKWLKKLTAN